jgi:hypothetical protein
LVGGSEESYQLGWKQLAPRFSKRFCKLRLYQS